MERDAPKWMVDAVQIGLAKKGWYYQKIPYETYQMAYVRVILPEYGLIFFGLASAFCLTVPRKWLYVPVIFFVLCCVSLGFLIYEDKRIGKIVDEMKAAEQTTETTPLISIPVMNGYPDMDFISVRYSRELATAIRTFSTPDMGYFPIVNNHIEGSRSSFERIMYDAMSQNKHTLTHTRPQWYNDCFVAVYGNVADVKV